MLFLCSVFKSVLRTFGILCVLIARLEHVFGLCVPLAMHVCDLHLWKVLCVCHTCAKRVRFMCG